jgi:hypothetical protein
MEEAGKGGVQAVRRDSAKAVLFETRAVEKKAEPAALRKSYLAK